MRSSVGTKRCCFGTASTFARPGVGSSPFEKPSASADLSLPGEKRGKELDRVLDHPSVDCESGDVEKSRLDFRPGGDEMALEHSCQQCTKANNSISSRDTFFAFRRHVLAANVSLFERAPFEIFLVSSTLHLPFLTLKARRLGFVTFQSFCLAGNTAWVIEMIRTSAHCAP